MDDEYTLLTSKEVSELKQDVDYLKKNPLGGNKSGKSLQESLDKLNTNIEMLIEIFKEASDTMKTEERESDVIAKRIEPMERQLMELSDQNQKIAKGILAVADMVSDREERSQFIEKPQPKPMMQQQRPPMMPPMQQQAPPMMPQPSFQPQPPQMNQLPPPPMPRPEPKKGLFGFK